MMKLIIILGVLLNTSLSGFAEAESSPKPSDDQTTISGTIEVARGVVQQLEDELAKNVVKTKFNALDYKAWNLKFRKQLNDQMLVFTNRVQVEVIQQIQPLVDQYNQILQSEDLRPDQTEALKAAQTLKLADTTNTLTAVYRTIYRDLLKNLMGWIPEVKIWESDRKECSWSSGARWQEFSYLVTSLDGKAKRLSDTLMQKAPRDRCFIPALTIQNAVENFPPALKNEILNKFLTPNYKTECQSQICMVLKQADYAKTLLTLKNNLDRGFAIDFKDKKHFEIHGPGFDAAWTLYLMALPVADTTLPFDTSGI